MATELRKSVATIDSPEFINITPENPTLSKCEIKVLYLGQNRNNSYITKEIATNMANSLPGCPIVGYFKEDKDDYRDHGEKIVMEGNEIYFNCMTKPYGFVSPDAKVWFQNFEDTDDFGNTEIRTYMMTTGYLWTEQYEEAKKVISEGRPQSMELSNLDGEWSTDARTGVDFFIINDATFSKLCILGNDVEPCFEGANITAPTLSKNFSKMDNSFRNTLFSMMQELKMTIEGGRQVDNLIEEVKTSETFSETEDKEEKIVEEKNQNDTEGIETEVTVEEENGAETEVEETVEVTTEDSFAKKKEEKEESEEEEKDTETEDSNKDKDEDDDDKKKKDKKYSLLEESYEDLKIKYQELEQKFQKVSSIAESYQLKEKDDLINSFTMLSDEDKKDVIENKSNYSLAEIESKLAVIGYRKKVNFEEETVETQAKASEEVITTFSFNESASEPAWIKAIINQTTK